ncbi:MAG: hypothetical protein AB3N33_12130 [Puniceicoccaceae bacterium]
MEKNHPEACPLLPPVDKEMSWRDLQAARVEGPEKLFEAALRYTQFLWLKQQPARAILALCRAVYIEPENLPASLRQPWSAYVWLLLNYNGQGFLGNPRISFLHQATRFRGPRALKKARAWALWHLTVRHMPDLPTDPSVEDPEPGINDLAAFLDENGLKGEGNDFLKALNGPGEFPDQ